MNTIAINHINNKLQSLSDDFVNDINDYLDFLNNSSKLNNEFILSDEQIAILDERSKSPIENFIPAEKVIENLRAKYGV